VYSTDRSSGVASVPRISVDASDRSSLCELILWAVEVGAEKDGEATFTDGKAVLSARFLIEFAARESILEGNAEKCSNVLSRVARRVGKSNHAEWWELLDWLPTLEPFQVGLSPILVDEVISTAQWSSKSVDGFAHHLRLLGVLLEHGARADISQLADKCADIEEMRDAWFLVEVLRLQHAYGADIQRVVLKSKAVESEKHLFAHAVDRLNELKLSQRRSWVLADAVAAGHSTGQLTQMLQEEGAVTAREARDRTGHNLMQVAALHDRADVIL